MLISKWRVAFKQNWKPKGCLFFNINSQNFAEISQSSVEKKSRIYLPCFSNLQSAPIIFTKLMKIQIALMRRFNVRLIIYLVGILVVGSSLEEMVMSRGHIDFHITKSGVCYKLSKISFESFSPSSISGERNTPSSWKYPDIYKRRNRSFCNTRICWTNQISHESKWHNCIANQFTGFYRRATLALNGLKGITITLE